MSGTDFESHANLVKQITDLCLRPDPVLSFPQWPYYPSPSGHTIFPPVAILSFPQWSYYPSPSGHTILPPVAILSFPQWPYYPSPSGHTILPPVAILSFPSGLHFLSLSIFIQTLCLDKLDWPLDYSSKKLVTLATQWVIRVRAKSKLLDLQIINPIRCVSVHVCVCVCLHLCVHVCVHAGVGAYVCQHMCVYIRVLCSVGLRSRGLCVTDPSSN